MSARGPVSQAPGSRAGSGSGSATSTTGRLLPFAVIALAAGLPLMTLSTLIQPEAPFLLATVLLALALPAVVLTHRESGRDGVRALLRDCARPPRRRWWLLLGAFGLPGISWVTATALGGGRPLTWGLVGYYVLDLVIGALVVNLWEEMAWTGFFQRRAQARWGLVGGSLVTSLFFTAIHVPLTFGDSGGATQVLTNLLLLAGLATGLRLLIARMDSWTGRSLLTVGVLHSSFNATESVLEPAFDWVRIACTIGLGIAVIAFGRQSR